MDFDMRELSRHFSQMCIEPGISTLVSPSRSDLAGRIAKHRAEPIVQSNRVAEFLFDRIDTSLRGICPNAQYVREIGNLDGGHLIGSLILIGLRDNVLGQAHLLYDRGLLEGSGRKVNL